MLFKNILNAVIIAITAFVTTTEAASPPMLPGPRNAVEEPSKLSARFAKHKSFRGYKHGDRQKHGVDESEPPVTRGRQLKQFDIRHPPTRRQIGNGPGPRPSGRPPSPTRPASPTRTSSPTRPGSPTRTSSPTRPGSPTRTSSPARTTSLPNSPVRPGAQAAAAPADGPSTDAGSSDDDSNALTVSVYMPTGTGMPQPAMTEVMTDPSTGKKIEEVIVDRRDIGY